MKSTYRILAVLLIQVLAVLLLARLARMSASTFPNVSISVFAAFAFGIPSLLGFLGIYQFAFTPSVRERSRILLLLSAAACVASGHLAGLIALSRTDIWLAERYISRTQAQLLADSRFSKFRLICCSADYVLFPYIASGGSVSSEEDRHALLQFIQDSNPPFDLIPLVWIDDKRHI